MYLLIYNPGGVRMPGHGASSDYLEIPNMNCVLSDSQMIRSDRPSNSYLQDGGGTFGSKYKHEQMA